MFKLSAPDWCFFKGDIAPPRYYQQLKELGIDGVEMVDPSRWAAARAAGLTVLNLSAPGMEKGLNQREHHASLIASISDCIATAKREGIPHVIVFSGNRAGLSDAHGIANCVAALKILAPIAADAGVTLVFEMLCAHDHRDYHADRSAFGFEVVRQVASPAVRVLYDIYHMARMGADVCADFAAQAEQIAHVHVAESPLRSAPTLAGDIPYGEILPRVSASGYAGYVGLEFVPRGAVMEDIATAVAVMRRAAGRLGATC